MMTDTEIKMKGYAALRDSLGLVDATRFIALIQRELFDYTKWREKGLETTLSIEELSEEAMDYQHNLEEQESADAS